MNYQYKKSRFRPRRPIRSFRDLEVYQKALEAAVMVAKNIYPALIEIDNSGREDAKRPASMSALRYPFLDEMLKTSLEVPRIIAEAHSKRFDSNIEGIALLERALADSNKMIVYMEQIRDLYSEKIERVLCEELIKRYIYNRRKILNLSKSWKKWLEEDKGKVKEN